jgi:hypothetical protein
MAEMGGVKETLPMRLAYFCLLVLPLGLAACNANGARAQRDFSAAGTNLGQDHIKSGVNDIGQGFSNGANATGDAIVNTAHQIGNGFSQ